MKKSAFRGIIVSGNVDYNTTMNSIYGGTCETNSNDQEFGISKNLKYTV